MDSDSRLQAVRRDAVRHLLFGMCSPLSRDQIRSNASSSNVRFRASQTSKETRSLRSACFVSSVARDACAGLRVTPLAEPPNFRARYRALPPMPQPTSRICKTLRPYYCRPFSGACFLWRPDVSPFQHLLDKINLSLSVIGRWILRTVDP